MVMKNPAAKKTRGRQRIEMKKIENLDDRYACFSKRKAGLFKMASDLSTLCGVNIGIILSSPKDKTHSFFSPNMDTVLRRLTEGSYEFQQGRDVVEEIMEANAAAEIAQLNKEIDEIQAQMEFEEKRAKRLKELDEPLKDFCFLDVPVEELDMESITRNKLRITNMIAELKSHIQSF